MAGYPSSSNVSSKNAISEFKEQTSGRPGVPQFFRVSADYDAKIGLLVKAMPVGRRTKRALFEALLDGQPLQLTVSPQVIAALSAAIQKLRKNGHAQDAEELVPLLRAIADEA